MCDATQKPLARFTIDLVVESQSSVSVRVTREMCDETIDPRIIDQALGPGIEEAQTLLAREIGALHQKHTMREILKRQTGAA